MPPSPPFHLLCFGSLSPLLLQPHSHLPPLPSALSKKQPGASPPWKLPHNPVSKALGAATATVVATGHLGCAPRSCSVECPQRHLTSVAAGRAPSNPGESSKAPAKLLAVDDPVEMERATAATRQARSDDFESPGTRFQTFVLLNYRCPVVRPLCFPLVSPVDPWISQSNGVSSAPPALVSNALSYHFCGPLEAFRVMPCSAFLFSTSVATDSVKNHLCRIGVFAIQGIIFHLHQDAAAARSFLRRSGNGVPSSKFESSTVAFSNNGKSPRPISAPLPSLGKDTLGPDQPNATLEPGPCLD